MLHKLVFHTTSHGRWWRVMMSARAGCIILHMEIHLLTCRYIVADRMQWLDKKCFGPENSTH